MKLLLTLFATGTILYTSAQSDTTYGLDSLNDEQKVQFIIDHFYEIYSEDFDRAIVLANEAKEIAIQNNWKEQEGYALLCYGVATYLRGDYRKTLPAFQNASDIFDSLDHKKGIADLNNELSVYYRKHKEWDKALAALKKSEEAAKEINDLEALGTSYAHQGAIHKYAGRHEEAKSYYDKVYQIRLATNDSVGLSYAYLDFAEYELTQNKNLKKSIEWVEKSTAIRIALGDDQGVAVNTVIMGECFFDARDFDRAIPLFQKTIELAKPIGYTDLIRYSYDMLQKAHIEIGDFQAAYSHLVNAQELSDSLFNIEKTKALADLETKYETEKKEQQIALQQAEIAEQNAMLQYNRLLLIGLTILAIALIAISLLIRSRARKKHALLEKEAQVKLRETEIEAAISSQEKERSRFAKDLHDGFGQMISILNLNLQSLEHKETNPHEVFDRSSQVLEEMYTELKSICFNLMPQTLIKKGIESALREFAARINSTGQKRVITDFFGIEGRLDDLQEISLYRISQEWVNNILKYSDAQNITIQLTKDEEEITLLIEDDGSGFDANQLIEGKGNGWRNMNSRTNLVNGTLELDTLPGRTGNTLIVNCPVDKLVRQAA